MKPALSLGLLFLLLAAPAVAQTRGATNDGQHGESIAGEALRREVSGSTIAGFHFRTFMRFSEYHAPDGHIYGHNGGVPVDKGCWDVKDDEVCYYYEGDTLPQGTWCWTFHRLAKAGQYRLEHRDTGGLALGVREEGNPRNWGDNGKPWQCSGLVSQNGRGPQSFALAGDRKRQSRSERGLAAQLSRIGVPERASLNPSGPSRP